jgi:methyl-accepting chemotaxis protein
MTLSKKLGLSFAAVLMVMPAASLMVFLKTETSSQILNRMVAVRYPATIARFEILASVQRTEDSLRNEVLFARDPARAKENHAARLAAWTELEAGLARYQDVAKHLTIQANRDRLDKIEKTLPLLREAQDRAASGGVADQVKADQLAEDVSGALRAMVADQRKLMGQEGGEMVNAMDEVRWTLGIATAVALLMGAVISAAFSRRFSLAVEMLLERADAISKGDLTGADIDVRSSDELGRLTVAINIMKQSLRSMIGSAARSAGRMAQACEEISASASQQAQGASLQRDQTTQVSAAMQEMSATVEEVSVSSVRAAEAARTAAETAREGGKIVADYLLKMRAIEDSMSAAADQVRHLGGRSEQIGEIVGVINDIAGQTNLLALNAAIEAARAGDQGRGFAVVADEVRKLAERTSKATKEIAEMIGHVQAETRNAVQAMEGGLNHVNLGVEGATMAGQSLARIIEMAGQVGEMTTQIATAATQQSAATEQISQAIEQIARITGESASGSHQSARACQDLSILALDMQKLVGEFRAAA